MSQLPPEFDEYQPSQYDPQFTADISMQMHIPDRIEVAGDNDPESIRRTDILSEEHAHLTHMVVPEKIILLGQDHSVGVRNEPNLHLDFMSVASDSSFVNLSTPPRVLTLDERSFPTLEDIEMSARNAQTGKDCQLTSNGRLFGRSRIAMHDLAALQQHLAVLSEHVKRLEAENARRWKRELILYPLLLGYVMLRVARWLVTAR